MDRFPAVLRTKTDLFKIDSSPHQSVRADVLLLLVIAPSSTNISCSVLTISSSKASVLMWERGENPKSDSMEDDTVVVIGIGNCLLDQNSVFALK